MFPRIERLVSEGGFGLRCWDDNYGQGVWACLAPTSSDLQELEDATNDGDIEAMEAKNFIKPAAWLPFVTGNGVLDAMAQLEKRLETLPEYLMRQDSHWSFAVTEALEHMRKVRAANGAYQTLSPDYQHIWK